LNILKIENYIYKKKIEKLIQNIGYIQSIFDGIAKIHGLTRAKI